jgi:hypothetical protein
VSFLPSLRDGSPRRMTPGSFVKSARIFVGLSCHSSESWGANSVSQRRTCGLIPKRWPRHHEIDDHLERGMTAEEERRHAYIRLGNPTKIRKQIWTMNSFSGLETFARNLRYACKRLSRSGS